MREMHKVEQLNRRGRRAMAAALDTLEIRRMLAVTPTSILLGEGTAFCEGGTTTLPASITLPPASVIDKVDFVLALDDTGSFASFSSSLASLFTSLATSLEAALPTVDFAFGVTRFEDYGGSGTGFSGENADGRPFTLNQPVVNASTAGGVAARNTLITSALGRTAPGFGGDGPETDIEALYQIATGAGFDGNGDGDSTDSGAAGSGAAQTSPGTTGDVPAFSTNVLPSSGTLGGVGWRAGSLHLVLLATDTSSVSAFPAGAAIPSTVTGAGGVSVPSSAFATTSSTPGSSRFGYISNSKTLGGNSVTGAVAPSGSAGVQQTIDALNALGIRVMGMGPGAAPTSSTAPTNDESTLLSALARLTGAVNAGGQPLVFSTSASPADLTTAIVNAITTTTTLPVDIDLTTTTLPAGVTFNFNTTGESGAAAATTKIWDDVAPGGTAPFSVSITGDGTVHTGSFEIRFRDVASGAILGTIPVTIDCPEETAPIVDISATSPINEGGSTTVSGTIVDPETTDTHIVTINWADGSAPTVINLAAGVLTFSATHTYLDDGPSPGNGTSSDNYTISATVVDSATLSGSDTTSVTVNNVAPSVTLTGPAGGTPGENRTFSGSFTDPGTLDVHMARVDFGDGTPVTPITLGPGKTFSVNHAFASTGSYTVKVFVDDDDLGQGMATASIKIDSLKPVDVQPDPCCDGDALYVRGTDGDDEITINKNKVIINDVEYPIPAEVRDKLCHVIVYAGDGDDKITAATKIPAWMFGQAGDDTAVGGAGDDLLIGGEGDDNLNGSSGRDVAIGGIGKDRVQGSGDDDIIIAGYTDYDWVDGVGAHEDIDLDAWCAITEEWLRTDLDAAGRSAHVTFTTPGGSNTPFFLTAATVSDDGDADILSGAGGSDLALGNFQGSGVLDLLQGGVEQKLEV